MSGSEKNSKSLSTTLSKNELLVSAPDYSRLSLTQLHLISLRSANSRRTLTSIFNNIAHIFNAPDHLSFDWLSLKPVDVNMMIAALTDRKQLRPTTVNSYISSLRSLFNTAYLNGLIDHETYQKIKSTKNVKATRITRNRALVEKDVLNSIITYCEGLETPLGVRDAAIIAILSTCGLRRAELASLTLDSYSPNDNTLNVIGKGNKERIVPVPTPTRARIDNWLDTYRGNDEGYLFCRVRRHGFISGPFDKPLSGNAIYDILKSRSVEYNQKHIRPHGLRRYCGTTLLNSGSDLILVRDYLGHESISTTQIYTEKSTSDLHEASKVFEK